MVWLRHYQHIIELAPLQIYSSALIFTSPKSQMRSSLHRAIPPPWISRAPQIEESLDSRILHNFHRDGTSSYGLLAFSGDAKLLAAESSGHGNMGNPTRIQIWEMGTGRLLNRLAFTSGYVVYGIVMAFSPDSTHFGAVRLDGTVEVWTVDSETSLWVKYASSEVRQPEISALAFSEDSKTITLTNPYLSAYQRTTWSVASGQYLGSSMGAGTRSERYHTLALGTSPEQVALASSQRSLEDSRRPSIQLSIWNIRDGTHVQTTTLSDAGKPAAFSRDLRLFAASYSEATFRVWRVDCGECLCELSEESCNAIAFSDDSRFLMTASDPGNVHVWALPSGRLARKFTIAPRGDRMFQSSAYVSIAPDLSLVASTQQADVRVWSATADGTLPEAKAREIGHNKMAQLPPATISPDSSLVSMLLDGGTRLDIQHTNGDKCTRTTLSCTEKPACQTSPCPISPNSVYLADTMHDSVIYVRHINSPSASSVVRSFHGKPPVAFSADASMIAFSATHGVCIAEILNETRLLSLRLSHGKVDAIAWSEDSRMVAIACFSTILIFNTDNGICIRNMDTRLATSKLKPIISVAFSEDSLIVAAITNEPVCGIYSVETGECLSDRRVKHHRRHLKQVSESVNFWPDGRLLTRHQAFKYQAANKLLKEAAFPRLGLTKDREWVTWDGHDLLWIPMDYRNRIGPTSEEVMLFLSLADDLEFIRFDPDELRFRYVNGVNG